MNKRKKLYYQLNYTECRVIQTISTLYYFKKYNVVLIFDIVSLTKNDLFATNVIIFLLLLLLLMCLEDITQIIFFF